MRRRIYAEQKDEQDSAFIIIGCGALYAPRERTNVRPHVAAEQILLITDEVQRALGELTDGDGICTIVTPHTTCAISVNENADPDVQTDLTKALRAMIPGVRFEHGEGNSDAHLLSMIIGTSLSWPYKRGKLVFGRGRASTSSSSMGRESASAVYVPSDVSP